MIYDLEGGHRRLEQPRQQPDFVQSYGNLDDKLLYVQNPVDRSVRSSALQHVRQQYKEVHLGEMLAVEKFFLLKRAC